MSDSNILNMVKIVSTTYDFNCYDALKNVGITDLIISGIVQKRIETVYKELENAKTIGCIKIIWRLMWINTFEDNKTDGFLPKSKTPPFVKKKSLPFLTDKPLSFKNCQSSPFPSISLLNCSNIFKSRSSNLCI